MPCSSAGRLLSFSVYIPAPSSQTLHLSDTAVNWEQTDAVCCRLGCLLHMPVTVVAHQIQGSVPWCELGSCLFLPLHCASFVSLSSFWCYSAFSPCLLPGLSLLGATSRSCIGLPPFTQSQEHPLALEFPSSKVTGSPTAFGLSL